MFFFDRDDCNIQLVEGRKYGLCGRNGIGKTTLLRAIASREIPDFPLNLRCLHVSQEVRDLYKFIFLNFTIIFFTS